MKLITAVVRPFKLDDVKAVLRAAGVRGVTVTEVLGGGEQDVPAQVYRGTEYDSALAQKVVVEVLVDLFDAERVAELVLEAARTGQVGDGKVWISEVEEVRRIRTGELGLDAL
jgi:nitrogen regulatory protein P-II 1